MDEGDDLGHTRPQLSPPRRRQPVSSSARDPMIGQQLGEYTVLERIGGGAMGIIYRGVQQTLSRPVAIKLVQSEHADDPVFIDRFLAEARAAASVHHPNIINVLSLGLSPSKHPYLVMELLEGDTLEDYLRYEGGRLHPRDAVELLSQTGAGLLAAHRAGVIHRDLKPSNIFVVRVDDENRFIKLLDFGVAKRTAPGQSARATAAMVGTPVYMAPEAADGGDVGPYTDVYSLGCVAYELVTGHPPFQHQALLALTEAHHNTVPEPPTGPGVPAALSVLILELLEKEPARRPPMTTVLRKLQQLAHELDAPQKTLPALYAEQVRPTKIRPAPTDPTTPSFADTREVARPTAVDVPATVLRTRPARRRRMGALIALAALAGAGLGVFVLWPKDRVVIVTPPPNAPDPAPAEDAQPEPESLPAAPKMKVQPKVARPAPGKEDPILRREHRIRDLKRRAARLEDTKARLFDGQLDGYVGENGPDVDQALDVLEQQITTAEKEAPPR